MIGLGLQHVQLSCSRVQDDKCREGIAIFRMVGTYIWLVTTGLASRERLQLAVGRSHFSAVLV